MSFVITDGTATYSLNPTYATEMKGKKIGSVHTTKSGQRYEYLSAEIDGWKLPAVFVTSADMTLVNSWWSAATILSLTPDYTTEVFTVAMENRSKPINKYEEPYDDLFKGSITLVEIKS